LRIEPRTKELVLKTSSDGPVTVRLAESLGNTVLRVAQAVTIPAFSETFVSARTNRSGLSLIRPAYRSSHDYVHVKNGILDLPPVGDTFQCLVANFSDSSLKLRNNQVVGVAEGQNITICTPSSPVVDKDQSPWEETLKQKLSHLSPELSRETFNTLRSFANMWDGHLGKIDAVQHHIVTEGPQVASQPYRAGPTARDNINDEVDRMLSLDFIEPSSSPWASPIVLIPKSDGSIRFCVDYRRLNTMTRKDSYALPRMDDCIDLLGTDTSLPWMLTLDTGRFQWLLTSAIKPRSRLIEDYINSSAFHLV
jgi:hypothetical protein